MIKQELEDLLRENNFREEEIRNMVDKDISCGLVRSSKQKLQKNINILLKYGISNETILTKLQTISKGKTEKIEDNIKILQEYGISKKNIENNISVLVDIQPKITKKILEILKENKVNPENCLYRALIGKEEEIEKLLIELKKYKIRNSVINENINVIMKYNAKDSSNFIELLELLNFYGIRKEVVERELKNLARKDVSKIKKIFELLEENGIKVEVREKYFHKIINANTEELEKIFDLMKEKGITNSNLTILLPELLETKQKDKEKRLRDIFDALEENNIEPKEIQKCPVVLIKGKGAKIRKIFKILKDSKYEISVADVKSGLSILKGNPENIEETLNILQEKNISNEAVKKCITVISKSNPDEVRKIFEILEKNGIIKSSIEKCLSMLTISNSNEIEKIFEVLKDFNKESINNSLAVIAIGNAEKIRNNLSILKKYKIKNEAIEKCITILSTVNPVNLDKMLEILIKNGVKKSTIEVCLTVFKETTPNNIYEVLKVLKNNEIDSTLLNQYYSIKLFKDPSYVKNIFSKKSVYIKDYSKFKRKYNKIITLEEIQEICTYKRCSIEEFIKQVENETTYKIVMETLEKKGNIYVGTSIPMNKEFMEKNGQFILDLSKKITANYVKKTSIKDFSEVQSFVIEVLTSRCGNIVYNMETNPEVMSYCLFSKCNKYLRMFEQVRLLDISTDTNNKFEEKHFISKNNSRTVDLSNWNINDDEKKLLYMLSNVLEEGYETIDAFEILAQRMGLEIDDIMEKINKIKNENRDNRKINKKIDEDRGER